MPNDNVIYIDFKLIRYKREKQKEILERKSQIEKIKKYRKFKLQEFLDNR